MNELAFTAMVNLVRTLCPDDPEMMLDFSHMFQALADRLKRESGLVEIKPKSLEELLLEAVEMQDFETAALLRDKINVQK